MTDKDLPRWVVEFDDCDEAVIRQGPDAESVNYPDDLGCATTRIRPIEHCEILSVWIKNEIRCEIGN